MDLHLNSSKSKIHHWISPKSGQAFFAAANCKTSPFHNLAKVKGKEVPSVLSWLWDFNGDFIGDFIGVALEDHPT